MRLIVHDASILIDLALSETVDAWFASGIETWTTDLIYPAEIDRPHQQELIAAYVAAGELRIRQVTADELQRLPSERARLGRGLSLADVSVFLLTQQFGPHAVLATGDRTLRAVAEREKLQACGILGLFDLMMDHARHTVLPPAVAIKKLQSLMCHPACRLPRDKCEECIKRWTARK